MISYTHKCIFVHIPKNAGSVMSTMLYNNLGLSNTWPGWGWSRKWGKYKQHLTMGENIEYGGIQRDELDLYFKFAFVRNPWDRAMSQFKYRQRLHGKEFCKSFKEFLLMNWGNGRDMTKQHMTPQYDFVYDQAGNLLVDFIGRFENATEDYNKVCDILNAKREHFEIKRSRKTFYWKYYDDETRQIVAEKYAKDIEYFGYEFGE